MVAAPQTPRLILGVCSPGPALFVIGRRTDFGAFPVAVRPKSGPEGRFTTRKLYCVTEIRPLPGLEVLKMVFIFLLGPGGPGGGSGRPLS